MADPVGGRPADVMEHAASLDEIPVIERVVTGKLEGKARHGPAVPDHPCIAARLAEQGREVSHARATRPGPPAAGEAR